MLGIRDVKVIDNQYQTCLESQFGTIVLNPAPNVTIGIIISGQAQIAIQPHAFYSISYVQGGNPGVPPCDPNEKFTLFQHNGTQYTFYH